MQLECPTRVLPLDAFAAANRDAALTMARRAAGVARFAAAGLAADISAGGGEAGDAAAATAAPNGGGGSGMVRGFEF